MSLEYISKNMTVISEDGKGIDLTLVSECGDASAHLRLLNCVIDIEDNPRTGVVEDATLTISHILDFDALYQLRDFLNKELPEKAL